jgi:hypothetical protein
LVMGHIDGTTENPPPTLPNQRVGHPENQNYNSAVTYWSDIIQS